MNETAQQNMENHPVIRTLYDHVDEVTCLAFHPTEQILASGSRDYTLKLFDYSKPSAKRAFKYIQVRNVWKEALLFFFLKYDELLCDYSLLKSSLCDHPRKEYGSWDGGGHVGHISLAHGFHAVMRPLPLASQDALGYSSHNKGSESITL